MTFKSTINILLVIPFSGNRTIKKYTRDSVINSLSVQEKVYVRLSVYSDVKGLPLNPNENYCYF